MSVHTNGTKPATPVASEAVSLRAARLSQENAQLQQAVHSHAVIDQAIGVLLAVGKLTPDQGWDILRAVSQHTNIKLRHVAQLLIEGARTGTLDQGIRRELDRQLAPYRPTQSGD
ncbi:ANTAR domain-containing protein [Streptomyces sp. NPDC006173]|uniref:ANTAR domain-containing protein n=1 Tax=Streptomyces sp. NPDC006173 TaxID=3155349 RepID=UPI0034100C72